MPPPPWSGGSWTEGGSAGLVTQRVSKSGQELTLPDTWSMSSTWHLSSLLPSPSPLPILYTTQDGPLKLTPILSPPLPWLQTPRYPRANIPPHPSSPNDCTWAVSFSGTSTHFVYNIPSHPWTLML